MKLKRTKTSKSLAQQMEDHSSKDAEMELAEYEGADSFVVSTGSTLLDLAISGGRFPDGGIPSGILVEIFGPASCGKTVMLCELAGRVQRAGGNVLFYDPEARLNKQFAKLFGLDTSSIEYVVPDVIPEVFEKIRSWNPDPSLPSIAVIDSLAALSTDLEMTNKDGDKMGMRRAKEFSEQLRKTCRILVQKNLLMVCSNQVRQNLDAGPWGQKYISPGGEAIGFYASLRLRAMKPTKLKVKKKVQSKEVSRVTGIETTLEVFKSSVWKPFHTASLTILYDYGIDDIRQNLQFIKSYTGSKVYIVGGEKVGLSLEKAIERVEERDLTATLKREVAALWREIENTFESSRKPRFE